MVFKILAPFPPWRAYDRKAGGDIYPPKLRTRYLGSRWRTILKCHPVRVHYKPFTSTWKIVGVSTLSNIQFSKEGIRPCMKSIWRDVGPTKLIYALKSKALSSDGLNQLSPDKQEG